MNSASGAKPTLFLADYSPPAWRVDAIALEFDLDREETRVWARLDLVQDAGQGATPLRLDAEDLELLEVRVDGRVLAAHEYRRDGSGLFVDGVAGRAVVETRVRLSPARNSALQGLYASGAPDGGFLLTQCEAEGFRRITPFIDRPDVLARYTVTLRADRARYPLLLANGNADGAGELADGRHWARFVDPHPKPSYLFALVAGRLERIEDAFTTAEGRRVRLVIHAETDAIGRCGWAMECVKLAMRWDEERFGRCYDLDAFHVVATHDFTMGAMENKGLNIFNAKYLLADPDSATDEDYRHVLAVVGHEYFHNWSGNRVTCRDWFQLCLKEGLTVYREQEFESDLASRTLRRIEDVRTLWRAQFVEDAGPLAHPVRPDRYSEINNFYTATVYEKGAEIVRMLALVLGREGFRRGLDRYFSRLDGHAATVEDFLAALGEANGRDLSRWLGWYAQAGTPELGAHGQHDAQARSYTLTLTQRTPPTPSQPHKRALPIPVALALFDTQGCALPLRLAGEPQTGAGPRVLLVEGEQATFRFVDIAEPGALSLLRGLSAPVRLAHDADDDALALLACHDDDGFNRWSAADALSRRAFARTLAGGEADVGLLAGCLARTFDDAAADPALLAEMLTLADANSLAEGLDEVDPEAVHGARTRVQAALARALAAPLAACHRRLAGDDPRATTLAAQARRRLRNACLAALAILVHSGAEGAQAALQAFEERHAHDALVLDKWFTLQATTAEPDALARIEALTGHAEFRWHNPNKVHALVGAFALRNPRVFHRTDGAGYRFVADAIVRVDALTPQVSARLATAFSGWRRYEPRRRAMMRRELERLAAHPARSPDLADIVARSLA